MIPLGDAVLSRDLLLRIEERFVDARVEDSLKTLSVETRRLVFGLLHFACAVGVSGGESEANATALTLLSCTDATLTSFSPQVWPD